MNGVHHPGGTTIPETREKKWGREVWHINGRLCVKTLTVRPGAWCSLHFHDEKEEIFLVESGLLRLSYVDTESGKEVSLEILPGGMFHVPRLVPHRFTAAGDVDCVFKEFSTHHEDSDSYRAAEGKA